jgi:hypothetical protein
MNKRGWEFSFAWLFALIVGAAILFLAIYGVTKYINTENTLQDAKTGKEIGVLLNPLETGFESFKTTRITFPIETRIYAGCNLNGYFGRQLIQVSQKNFGKWTETDLDVGFSNKYIFSEIPLEGKEAIVFSKPFEFPFKITDLIYMIPSNKYYCFEGAPEEIKEELGSMNSKNLLVENCSSLENPIRVCFSSSSKLCEIRVDYGNFGSVTKNSSTLYFNNDALMYAAIFSDIPTYECQIKRLMLRVGSLCDLYKNKASFIARAGCHNSLGEDLMVLKNQASALENSQGLQVLEILAEDIEKKNENNGECRLW